MMSRAFLLICRSLPGSEPQEETLFSLTLASAYPGFLVASGLCSCEPLSCIGLSRHPDLHCLLCMQILMFLTPAAYLTPKSPLTPLRISFIACLTLYSAS